MGNAKKSIGLQARSGGEIFDGGDPSRSRAGLADEALAALADAAGAVAPHTGFLNDWRGPVIVNRKTFSEIHGNILRFTRSFASGRDIIGGALRPRRANA
jgi:hypothetical protein